MKSFNSRVSLLLPVLAVVILLLILGAAMPAHVPGRLNAARDADKTYAPAADVLLTIPGGSSGSEMIIQLSVPGFASAERVVDGRRFQQISLPGYGRLSDVGKPGMPAKGFLIAVPEGASLVLEMLDSEGVSFQGYDILPAPKPSLERIHGEPHPAGEFRLDEIVYASHRLFPERVAQVVSYGYLRDIRVAQVRICPVQYNPAKRELIRHAKLRLKATLIGGRFPDVDTAGRASVSKNDPFEAVYRKSILNYGPSALGTARPVGGTDIPGARLEYLRNECYKVAVLEDGIYEIDYQDLLNVGIDVESIDPRTIKISNLGKESSILVNGEEDGTLDPPDFIEFFGQGNRSEYCDTNVYWISWGGERGLRMGLKNCSPGDSLPIPVSFTQKIHIEENHVYYSSVFEGEGRDHWFWEQLNAPCVKTYPIRIPDVSGIVSDITVTMNARGKTDTPHRAELSVNRYAAGSLEWYGMEEAQEWFACPRTALSQTANQCVINCPLSSLDQIFFNWIDIEYRRKYAAHEGMLRFRDSQAGANQFEVRGFPDGLVELYRVNDRSRVMRLVNFAIRVDEATQTYTLAFQDSMEGGDYIAVNPPQRKKPALLTRDEPSDLRSPANQADYVIITHRSFERSVRRLKDLREAEGLSVAVAAIDDVYDEFSYGNVDPRAIKDFLRYAFYNWRRPAPSFVLLVGDASYDRKGYIAGGNRDYVPTHLFVSQSDYLETASDDWHVCFVGDDWLPDMLIGRLPAHDESDADAMVQKIIDYETNLPPGDWRRTVLLVADNPEPMQEFEAMSEGFAERYFIPAGFDTAKVYVSRCRSTPYCRQSIIEGMDRGCAICSYSGHGAVTRWAHEMIFTTGDVAALSNGPRLPLVVTFDCLNGYFHDAIGDFCLAEEFVRAPGKGAVACWSPSGLGYAFYWENMGNCLYDALVNDGEYVLGSAACEAKIRYLATSPEAWDQAAMLILFGDPALEMGFPGRPDLVPGSIVFRPVRPLPGERDTIVARMYNAGREDAAQIVVRFALEEPESSRVTQIADVTVPSLAAGGQVEVPAVWDSVPGIGAYRVRVSIDPDNRIVESCEWNNSSWDTLRVRDPSEVQDTIPPSVEISIDGRTPGEDFRDGDFVSSNPRIEAVIRDDDSGINTPEIRVSLNGSLVADFHVDKRHAGAKEVTLTCVPNLQGDGTYRLVIDVCDCGGRPNAARGVVTFVLQSRLAMIEVMNSPNPFNRDTRISFSLSQTADDVAIDIYSVTGALIRRIRARHASQNRNSIAWDGRDDSGGEVASGIYFYRINAAGAAGRAIGVGKLVLLK